MNRKERHNRDIKILEYIKLNPMAEDKSVLVRNTAKKFAMDESTIWRKLKMFNQSQNFEAL